MSNYDIEIEGADELIRNLQKIDASIRNDVAVKAVTAGAIQVGNKARMNAPVKTGALRNSAGYSLTSYTNTRVDTSVVNGQAEAEVGFRGLAYARIQEFGGMAGRNHAVKIRGKHYLQRAINSEKALVEKAMADVIRHFLEQ